MRCCNQGKRCAQARATMLRAVLGDDAQSGARAMHAGREADAAGLDDRCPPGGRRHAAPRRSGDVPASARAPMHPTQPPPRAPRGDPSPRADDLGTVAPDDPLAGAATPAPAAAVTSPGVSAKPRPRRRAQVGFPRRRPRSGDPAPGRSNGRSTSVRRGRGGLRRERQLVPLARRRPAPRRPALLKTRQAGSAPNGDRLGAAGRGGGHDASRESLYPTTRSTTRLAP